MDSCVTLGSWDVAADLTFHPSVPNPRSGKEIDVVAGEGSGLEFICSSRAGREAIGGILKLRRKFDRGDVPVGGFKGLEIVRQLRQLLVVLHETGSQRSTPTKDTLHQVSSICREVLRLDSLDNHAYAKIMDNFAVVKYGLKHGRTMSPCNRQGIRFWYTIASKDACGIPDDDVSEDSWRVGADCPVLQSMELEMDSASSGTFAERSLSPISDGVPDPEWGTGSPTGLTFPGGAAWVAEHETHGKALQKAAAFDVEEECTKETEGCRCGLLLVVKKLFRRSKRKRHNDSRFC